MEPSKLHSDDYWFRKMDWKRNMKFSMWSGLWCGSIQHYQYNVLFPSIFPGTCFKTAFKKALTDSLITCPFIAMPFYFGCKAVFMGESYSEGIANYKRDIWTIMKTYWSIWFPAIMSIMYFVPLPFRIACIGGVSLMWLTILSYQSPCIEQPVMMEKEEMKKEKLIEIPVSEQRPMTM